MESIELVVTVGSVLWLLSHGPRLRGGARAAAWTLGALLFAVHCHSYARLIVQRIANPPEWDFLCFWTWGRIGLERLDFYDPSAGAAFAAGRSPTFVTEIIDVGFWYPPHSMLMLLPLGLAQPPTALAVWYAIQAGCLLGAVWLLYRLLANDLGPLGWLAIGTFVLAMPGAKSTFVYAQTHAVALLLSMLVLRDLDRARAGVWAGLALIVKPYLGIWLGVLALHRSLRGLASGALVVLAIVFTTTLLFGAARYVTYALDNPMQRVPLAVFSEGINQSLVATLLRVTHSEHAAREPLLRLAGAAAVAVVAAPSLWAAYRLRRLDPLLSAAVILTATLVAYPFTLIHYSVMLVVPLLLLWTRRASLLGGPVFTAFAVTGLVAASGVAHGLHTFWVHLATLAWLLVEARRALLREPGRPGQACRRLRTFCLLLV